MKGQDQSSARLLTGAWTGTPASVPEGRLDISLLDVKELVRRAFGEPQEAGVLVLELRRSRHRLDRNLLFQKLPWLHEVADAEKIAAELLEKGWVLLKCGSREVAERLCPSHPGP